MVRKGLGGGSYGGGGSDGGSDGDEPDEEPEQTDARQPTKGGGSGPSIGGGDTDTDTGGDGSDDSTDGSEETDARQPTKGGGSGPSIGGGDTDTGDSGTDTGRDPERDQSPPRGQPTPSDAGEDDIRPETRDLMLDRMDDPDRGTIDPGLEEDPGRVDEIDEEYRFEGMTAETYVSQRREELREAGYEPDEFSIQFSEDEGFSTEYDEELIEARDSDAVRQDAASELDAFGAGDIGVREVERDGETVLEPYVTDQAREDLEDEQLADRERAIAAELGVAPSEVDASTEWDRSEGVRGMVTGGDPTQQVVTDLSPEAERAALADALGVDRDEVQLREVGPASGDPRKPGMDPGREDTPYLTEEGEVSVLADQTDLDESDIAGVRREGGQLTPELTPEAEAERIAQQNEDVAREDLTIDEDTGEVSYAPERERIFERSTPVLGQIETYYAPDERLFAEDTPVLGATESALEPETAPRATEGTRVERLLRLAEAGNLAAAEQIADAAGDVPSAFGGAAAAYDAAGYESAADRLEGVDTATRGATEDATEQFIRFVEPAGIGLLGAEAARFGASELQAEIDEVEEARETVLDAEERLTPGDAANVLPFLGPSTVERRQEQAGTVAATGAAAGGAYVASAQADPLETGARTVGGAAALAVPPLAARGALRAGRSAARGATARAPDIRGRLPETRIERRPDEPILQVDPAVRQQVRDRFDVDLNRPTTTGVSERLSDVPAAVGTRVEGVRDAAGGAATGLALRAESNVIRARDVADDVTSAPSRVSSGASEAAESIGTRVDEAAATARGAALRTRAGVVRRRRGRRELTLEEMARGEYGQTDAADAAAGYRSAFPGGGARPPRELPELFGESLRITQMRGRAAGEAAVDRIREVPGETRSALGDALEETPSTVRAGISARTAPLTERAGDITDEAMGTVRGAALRTRAGVVRRRRGRRELTLEEMARGEYGQTDAADAAAGYRSAFPGGGARPPRELPELFGESLRITQMRGRAAGEAAVDRIREAPGEARSLLGDAPGAARSGIGARTPDIGEYSIVVRPRRPARQDRVIDLGEADNVRITEIEEADIPTASGGDAPRGAGGAGDAAGSGSARIRPRAPGQQSVVRTEQTLYDSRVRDGGVRPGPVTGGETTASPDIREFDAGTEVRGVREEAETTLATDTSAGTLGELDDGAVEATSFEEATVTGSELTGDMGGELTTTATGETVGTGVDPMLSTPQVIAPATDVAARERLLGRTVGVGAGGGRPPIMPPFPGTDDDADPGGPDTGISVGRPTLDTEETIVPGWLTETYTGLAGIDRADLDVDTSTDSLFGEFGFELSEEQEAAFEETRELLRV